MYVESLVRCPLNSSHSSVTFTSKDPHIHAFISKIYPDAEDIYPDSSTIEVSSNADDKFTITRSGGKMFGLPVTPFTAETSTVAHTLWFLERIYSFHELLEDARNKDDASVILRMFRRIGDAIGPDLVTRNGGLPAVVDSEHPRRYCLSLRNERYEGGFCPKMLYLNPENYEVAVRTLGNTSNDE